MMLGGKTVHISPVSGRVLFPSSCWRGRSAWLLMWQLWGSIDRSGVCRGRIDFANCPTSPARARCESHCTYHCDVMCVCCERKKNQKKVVEEDRCDGLGSGSCALSGELTDGVELEDGIWRSGYY